MTDEVVKSLYKSIANAAAIIIESDLGKMPLFQVIANAYIKGMIDYSRVRSKNKGEWMEEVMRKYGQDLYNKPWVPTDE